MSRIRHHSQRQIELTLDWCEQNAALRAAEVSRIGLAYVHGLNEHQIARTRLLETAPRLALSFPLARRAREILTAPAELLPIEEPAWLELAVRRLAGTIDPDAPWLYR